MKNKILVLLLVFGSAFAYAQSLVLDTTYIVASGYSFSQVKEKVFDDGRIRREYIPYDSSQLMALYLRLHQDRCEDVIQSALSALPRQRTVRQLRDYDQRFLAATGISLADSIAKSLYDVHLHNRTINLDSSGTVITAQINKRANGGFNLRMNGVNYRLDIFDKRWLRVRNFPRQGIDTDLWLWRGEYVSFDGVFNLRLTNGATRNSAPSSRSALRSEPSTKSATKVSRRPKKAKE